MTTVLPRPQQVASDAMQRAYGPDSEWAEPNEFNEQGFTRAQAESDIGSDEIEQLIVGAVEADRKAVAQALNGPSAVEGFRLYPLATVDDLIEALRHFDGDEPDFVDAWNDFAAGKDFPCPAVPHGVHQVSDGSCDLCGDRNRQA